MRQNSILMGCSQHPTMLAVPLLTYKIRYNKKIIVRIFSASEISCNYDPGVGTNKKFEYTEYYL